MDNPVIKIIAPISTSHVILRAEGSIRYPDPKAVIKIMPIPERPNIAFRLQLQSHSISFPDSESEILQHDCVDRVFNFSLFMV